MKTLGSFLFFIAMATLLCLGVYSCGSWSHERYHRKFPNATTMDWVVDSLLSK